MMGRSLVRWILAAGILTTIVASSVVVAVREGQVAVVTRFGAPRTVWPDAGLHLKWPWPIEQVWRFDARQRLFNSRFVETLTRDKKNIVLRTFVIWSIGEPLTFLQSVGDLASAEDRLDGLVTNAKNAVLGRYELVALVSTDPTRLKVPEIEADILADVRGTARERFGVDVRQVGLKQLGCLRRTSPLSSSRCGPNDSSSPLGTGRRASARRPRFARRPTSMLLRCAPRRPRRPPRSARGPTPRPLASTPRPRAGTLSSIGSCARWIR